MPIDLIDIGANLTHDSFDDDRDEVIQRASDAGVRRMILTGSSEQGSRDAVALAETRPGRFYATAGVHPHHASDYTDDVHSTLTELAAHDVVVAVGECGLDYFRNFSPQDEQRDAFRRQLGLAAETGLPVFLHQRDALYIGITGWVCDERRGENLKNIVGQIPLDRLLIETDAPYLLPRTLKSKPKTRRNEPMYLREVLRVIAEASENTESEIASATTANAERFFAI